MNVLPVNQLIEFVEAQRVERILWVDPREPGYILIDIREDKAVPHFLRHAHLAALEEEGLLRVVPDDPYLSTVAEHEVVETHRAMRDQNWARIAPLLAEQPAIFEPDQRGKLIAKLVSERGESRHSLYRLLRRYWQRGLTRNALLPDYGKCGGRGKTKAAGSKARGRPPKYADASINVTPALRMLFSQAITRLYATKPTFDVAECYHAMLLAYFSDPAIDPETGRQKLIVRPDSPTLRQFRYWYEKDNDVFQVLRRRRTPRVYDKDMRGLRSSSTAEVTGPGARYQIDATIADVYLVSRFDKKKIIGRPVVYVVIDVFSRMITGIHVGIEGPSWVGAMEALANAVLDKVEYCNRFGIPIASTGWPSVGMPERLLGDRGELAGRMVETLVHNFGVNVENTAPYRADWKGIVEQRFRLLPARFKAYVPGYIQEDYRQRGGQDYRLDATLDIDAFTRILIYCVLYYNNEHRLKDYPLDPEMIQDAVKPIPIELWEWGIARRSGRLRSYPPDLVRLSLLPSDDATVTRHGIRFYGCYYSCPLAIEEHWFDKARQRSSWGVKISYDPRDMDHIYLHGQPGQPSFITCALTDLSRDFTGRTLWEIDQLRQEARRLAAPAGPQDLSGRISLIDRIQTIVDEAEAEAPAVKDLTKRQRTADIRGNRQEERRALQRRDAIRPERPSNPEPADIVRFPGVPTSNDYSQPDITELLRRFGEDEEE
jgi:hypothetical protein